MIFHMSKDLRAQYSEFISDPELAVCGTNYTAVDKDDNELFCTNFPIDHDTIFAEHKQRKGPVIPNSFLFKREVLDVVGLYNEFFDRVSSEDNYWTYLILEKFALKNIRLPHYYFRYHSGTMTSDRSDNRAKFYTSKMLEFLFDQRNRTGTDYLEQGDYEALNKVKQEFDAPFQRDPALFYRELARREFYLMKNPRKTVKFAFQAIRTSPFQLLNWKEFFL